jgi:membrane associated rhomboid family serine protease
MLDSLLYIITILAAFFAGMFFVRNSAKRFAGITILFSVILLLCLIFQVIFPDILLKFQRNTTLIHEGEWWRICTALFFQDGFIFGGVTNIIFLLMIGTVAEQIISRAAWITVYLLTGCLAELVAMYWQPIGAGNSIAYFGLASTIVLYIILKKRKGLAMYAAIISVVSATLLLIRTDIHGAAFFIGLIISAFIILLRRKVSANGSKSSLY